MSRSRESRVLRVTLHGTAHVVPSVGGGSNLRFHRGAGLPAGEAQRSGAGGWEWTLPETFSWYTPELGGLLLMLTGVGWTDRACIKCSAWSDHVFWRSIFIIFTYVKRYLPKWYF